MVGFESSYMFFMCECMLGLRLWLGLWLVTVIMCMHYTGMRVS